MLSVFIYTTFMELPILEKASWIHTNKDRELIRFTNDDIIAREIKILTILRDSYVWWYSHPHNEKLTVTNWKALFRCMVNNEIQHFIVSNGYKLSIPKEIPHDALMVKWTKRAGASEAPFISPETYQTAYDNFPPFDVEYAVKNWFTKTFVERVNEKLKKSLS